MRTVDATVQIFFLCLLLAAAGCEPAPVDAELSPNADNGSDVFIYARYAPVKIDIMPLTEFNSAGVANQQPQINIYASLLDSSGCQLKSPGVFRFELYEYVQRSGRPKGKRIAIWPDIDLSEHSENNRYWRDFLRAYEFNLDFEPQVRQSYVLQVTFLRPGGKRLSAELCLKHSK